MQWSSLIREPILYQSKMVHDATEKPKIFVVQKVKEQLILVPEISWTRWFKKFRSGCKKLDDEARLEKVWILLSLPSDKGLNSTTTVLQ